MLAEVFLILTLNSGDTVKIPQPGMQVCRENLYSLVIQQRRAVDGMCVNVRTGETLLPKDTR